MEKKWETAGHTQYFFPCSEYVAEVGGGAGLNLSSTSTRNLPSGVERKWGTAGHGLGSDGVGRWSTKVDKGGAA